MGRIRTIKPSFFTSEEMADLLPLERLLFIGLWTEADKAGCLTDRPRELKVKLLPWDDCNVEEMLARLDAAGIIHRYEVDGVRCIHIPGFEKHQRPHPKEASAGLPPPPSRVIPRPAVKGCSVIPSGPGGREGKGREGDLGSGKESPPPPPVRVIPDPPKPAENPRHWTGIDFWAWAQEVRRTAGVLPEQKAPPNLDRWYSAAMLTLNGNVEVLQEAYYRFGDSAFWQQKTPPCPFAGFTAQWDSFVPIGGTRVS